ncbi:probable proline--tRNA ligase, mitochondrial [Spea bombifrons]|uniref:probable proline--tRNA ligase, mitochondrial n=1 Tax=Spea bombifrons TaxID=233779 RepID=UPI00234AFA13|nr:probable proline--tRNA ligase, mitochondrial [Spea bombifrons]XP_053324989.1 probable proline--tRNA ligase, mitochondrial [Spea bombifrons]
MVRLLRPCCRLLLPNLSCRSHHNDSAKGKRLLLSRLYQPRNIWEEQSSHLESKSNERTSKSHKLMIRAGLIQSSSPGCFHFLPYTVRSIEKLIRLIDKEMHGIGGQKVDLTSLHPADLWRQSGRWDLMGKELFRLVDRHNQDYCLGPTHEEVVTHLVSSGGSIYHKQLPLLLYQITRKFRDEPRPCFGLIRSREFYMKDMYTFDATEEAAFQTYNEVCQAYSNIFSALGLNFVKVQADTGNIGGKISHEFQLPATIGEDRLLVCQGCGFSANVETLQPGERDCPSCKEKLTETKGIEIGHTFYLGTKYSHIFNATCYDSQAKPFVAEMGCYGIGVSRLLAASLEVLSTEDDIHWPGLIAPYQVCLIPPKKGSKESEAALVAESLYDEIIHSVCGLRGEIVLDDRNNLTIGKRVKEAQMMGYPFVVVVGRKALENPPVFEVRSHNAGEVQFLSREGLIDFLKTVQVI